MSEETAVKTGPLAGVRIVEFAGLGPAPFCTMLLADMGADVLRIDRPGRSPHPADVTWRGRRSIALDLKNPADIATCLAAIDKTDGLLERSEEHTSEPQPPMRI